MAGLVERDISIAAFEVYISVVRDILVEIAGATAVVDIANRPVVGVVATYLLVVVRCAVVVDKTMDAVVAVVHENTVALTQIDLVD